MITVTSCRGPPRRGLPEASQSTRRSSSARVPASHPANQCLRIATPPLPESRPHTSSSRLSALTSPTPSPTRRLTSAHVQSRLNSPTRLVAPAGPAGPPESQQLKLPGDEHVTHDLPSQCPRSRSSPDRLPPGQSNGPIATHWRLRLEIQASTLWFRRVGRQLRFRLELGLLSADMETDTPPFSGLTSS